MEPSTNDNMDSNHNPNQNHNPNHNHIHSPIHTCNHSHTHILHPNTNTNTNYLQNQNQNRDHNQNYNYDQNYNRNQLTNYNQNNNHNQNNNRSPNLIQNPNRRPNLNPNQTQNVDNHLNQDQKSHNEKQASRLTRKEKENQDIQQGMVVSAPHEFDVVKGRGNGANLHPGNIAFRKLVTAHKDTYYVSSNDEKKRIVVIIIDLIQSSTPAGRFLTEDCGVWRLMDEKSVLRKVGQALREQKVNKDNTETQVNGENSGDIPPNVINIASPAGEGEVSLNKKIDDWNKNSKKRMGTLSLGDIRNDHKLPKIGEKDTHRAEIQQHQIRVVNKEVGRLREQVSLLSKRLSFFEAHFFEEKKTSANDVDLSYSVRPDLLTKDAESKVTFNSGGQPEVTHYNYNAMSSFPNGCVSPNPSGNSANPPGKSSLRSVQPGAKYFLTKPSLQDFSKKLESSIRDITNLDNPEDALFDLLTR